MIRLYAVLIFISSYAQARDTLEIYKNHNDVSYFMHIVKAKETLYSISRSYNCDANTLLNFNTRENKDFLDAGDILKIPFDYTIACNNQWIGRYKISKGDNLHRVSDAFSIESNEIISKNNIKNNNLLLNSFILLDYGACDSRNKEEHNAIKISGLSSSSSKETIHVVKKEEKLCIA